MHSPVNTTVGKMMPAYTWAPLLQPTLEGWNMIHFRDYSHKYFHYYLN